MPLNLRFAVILTAIALVQCQDSEPNRCGGQPWKQFRNSCYMYLYWDPQSWWMARQTCRRWGADLVCISSKAENDFVTDMTDGKEAWIGLRDVWPRADQYNPNPYESGADKWIWTDESQYRYTNWAPGQPSGLQDCVQINWGGKGKWDDQDYWAKNPFVCEKPRPES